MNNSNQYQTQNTLRDDSIIRSVTHLSNGNVISGSENGKIKVWHTYPGACLSSLQGHSAAVLSIVVFPDGKVISGSNDATIKVWDINSKLCIATLKGHHGAVWCIAVLSNKKIISGSDDATLKVWDIYSGSCIATWTAHTDSVKCVAVLPNGNVLSGSNDATLKIWDIYTGTCLATWNGHSDPVVSAVVLPNGKVVSGSWDKTLKVWDVNSSTCLDTLLGHTHSIRSLVVKSNEKVISSSDDETLKLWDINSGSCLATWQGHSDIIYCIDVLPNGHVISGARDKTLMVWGPWSLGLLPLLEWHDAFDLRIENLFAIISAREGKNEIKFETLNPIIKMLDINVVLTDKKKLSDIHTLMCMSVNDLYKLLCLFFSLQPKSVYWPNKSLFTNEQLAILLQPKSTSIEGYELLPNTTNSYNYQEKAEAVSKIYSQLSLKQQEVISKPENEAIKTSTTKTFRPLPMLPSPLVIQKNSEHMTIFPENFKYLEIFKIYRKEILDFIGGKSSFDVITLVQKLFKEANTVLLKAVLLEAIEYGKVSITFGNKVLHSIREQLLLIEGVKSFASLKKIDLSDSQLIDLLYSCHEQLKKELETEVLDKKNLQQPSDLTLILLTGLKMSIKQGKNFNEKQFFKNLTEQHIYQSLKVALFDTSLSLLKSSQFKNISLKSLWTAISEFLLSYFNFDELNQMKNELTKKRCHLPK